MTLFNTRRACDLVKRVGNRTEISTGMEVDGANRYNTGRIGLSRGLYACGRPW
jgi:hypothetical protein